jgi:hypothetical protein
MCPWLPYKQTWWGERGCRRWWAVVYYLLYVQCPVDLEVLKLLWVDPEVRVTVAGAFDLFRAVRASRSPAAPVAVTVLIPRSPPLGR